MLLSNLHLAWQLYHQERKLSHQRFTCWIHAILMIFIVTLGQTSHSIQNYLSQNLQNLLGADIVISQKSPLNASQETTLRAMSQQLILTKDLTTTLTHKQSWQRVKLKAVGENYPLQGELQTSSSLKGKSQATLYGPKVGEIWLGPRSFTSLSLQIGDVITLADQRLTVSRILLHEPDRLMEDHNTQMRALIHLDDMKKLQFPDDIIQHRYLLAVDSQQLAKILVWQKQNLPAAQAHHKQGNHPLALFWQRTENFIGLASIILFFMAAIAIEQLSHVQIQKAQYFSAICMSVGASRIVGLQISSIKWCLHWFFLLPIVLLISILFHWGLSRWLSHTFADLTWQWNTGLAITSLMGVTAILLIFQLPVWISLKHSSIFQLINHSEKKVSYWLTIGCAVLVFSIVALAYSDNILLTTMVLMSMAICATLNLLISWFTLTLGEKLSQDISGLVPFALFMMKQRLLSKSTQILGVGLCTFLLLFTLMLMKDLGDSMRAYQRHHDGNLLVSQATKAQMDDIKAWSQRYGAQLRQSKPYMQAKLTKINAQYLFDYHQTPSDSLATLKRSIRLHWSDTIPNNNRLVSGRWWERDDTQWQQLSIEQEVMTDLGLSLGDKLSFYIGQQNIEFEITASHAYKPSAGTITFWVQMPPAALAHIEAPHYNMASLELSENQFLMLGELWQQHPSLRMVSLEELTARFDRILSMVTQMISGFSVLIIILAAIVIMSSSRALEAREKKKNSIIMSFGFDKQTCFRLNLIEWIITGLIAAGGAIAATYIAGVLLYQAQFSLNYQADLLWLLGTLALTLCVVTSLGVWSCKNSLSVSIRHLMTE